MPTLSISDYVGFVGAGLLLAAFGLSSNGRLAADSKLYLLLNITGSAAIAANSIYHQAFPSAILNVVWAAIAVFALMTRHRR